MNIHRGAAQILSRLAPDKSGGAKKIITKSQTSQALKFGNFNMF